jgi:chromate transporter
VSGRRQGAWEVFTVALRLGLTSFGGPFAHLGYFERVYVQRRKWLTPEAFGEIVALCQMLPGPVSSQVGFLIGLRRAGWAGAAAAWLGFTAPSAALMFAFALAAPRMTGSAAAAILHGLKLTAVVIVAQAVWSMARRLTPDLARGLIAGLAATLVLEARGPIIQLSALAAAAVLGAAFLRRQAEISATPRTPVGPRGGAVAFAAFLMLLIASVVWSPNARQGPLGLAAITYRAGALVFGGGHVVLPLLRAGIVPLGWLSDSQFLAGYGAAQALPGPLFAVAAFLGASAAPAGAGLAALAAWATAPLVGIFLPGLLLVVAGARVWDATSRYPWANGAIAGVNAAVVGVLAAALYTPIGTAAVRGPADVVITGLGLVLLLLARAPPLAIIALNVAAALGVAALEGPL